MEKQITNVDIGLWCRQKRTTNYSLTSVELYTENCLHLLLEKLDAAFQSEDVEDAYNVFLHLVF